MAPLAKRFGNLVAAHRKARGWTQAQLAEQVNLSVDMIAKMETGSAAPSFRTLERLSKALAVDPAELFTAELAGGAFGRGAVSDLQSRLVGLSEPDLKWLSTIVDAVLKPRS